MNIQEKIELIKAANLLAKFWETSVGSLLCLEAMSKKDKKEEWNKIANEVISFQDMSFEEKAKEFGFKVSYTN